MKWWVKGCSHQPPLGIKPEGRPNSGSHGIVSAKLRDSGDRVTHFSDNSKNARHFSDPIRKTHGEPWSVGPCTERKRDEQRQNLEFWDRVFCRVRDKEGGPGRCWNYVLCVL